MNKNRSNVANQIVRWIATKLLNIPSHIYDATGKVDTVLQGLVKKVGLVILSGNNPKDYLAPDFDMSQIENAYRADGYVREAIDKYVDLIMKHGYDITGKNPKSTEYIKARLAYMGEVTGKPLDILITEIATDMMKFNNVIIAKARTNDKNALPPGANVKGLDGADPIGGYFIQPVTTFKVKRDKNGTIQGWQQDDGAQAKVKFKTTDIIHMYLKKSPGDAFAYPKLLAIIEDVRALREIEENVLAMIYKNIHPLLHVKVGSKDLPATPGEVDTVRDEIDNMSVDGALLTTDRVNIDAINTKTVVEAITYLNYFEKRTFTGLGVSETMMGRGDSANRSTGDNQKEEAVDRVKSIQKIIATFINFNIMSELLREGGYDPLNKPEDIVEFGFKDPDTDAKIKQEAHTIFLYQSNGITEVEMRKQLGRDPISDADRATLWFNQYGKKDTSEQASNTIMPENQSGKKKSPGKTKNAFNYALNDNLVDLKKQLLKNVELLYQGHSNSTYVKQIINDTQTNVISSEHYISKLIAYYYGIDNFNSISNSLNNTFKNIYDMTIDTMSELNSEILTKETISAMFDVFIDELKYVTKELKEEFDNE